MFIRHFKAIFLILAAAGCAGTLTPAPRAEALIVRLDIPFAVS